MPRDKNRRGYGSRARFLYQLKEAGVSSYAEYLRSDHWREIEGFMDSAPDLAVQTSLRAMSGPGRPIRTASQEL
jgi:hypothetical protein